MTTTRKLRHPRSGKWPAVMRAHLETEPCCAVCGSTKDLNVHHVLPVHLFPEHELDPTNLITLCESRGANHHLLFGHLLNWKAWNPHVVLDAGDWRKKITTRRMAA